MREAFSPSANLGRYVAMASCSSTKPWPTAKPTAMAVTDLTIEKEFVRVVASCPRKYDSCTKLSC